MIVEEYKTEPIIIKKWLLQEIIRRIEKTIMKKYVCYYSCWECNEIITIQKKELPFKSRM